MRPNGLEVTKHLHSLIKDQELYCHTCHVGIVRPSVVRNKLTRTKRRYSSGTASSAARRSRGCWAWWREGSGANAGLLEAALVKRPLALVQPINGDRRPAKGHEKRGTKLLPGAHEPTEHVQGRINRCIGEGPIRRLSYANGCINQGWFSTSKNAARSRCASATFAGTGPASV